MFNDPVAGATVTLYSLGTTGTYLPVPDGSPVMSAANRKNPDLTAADGTFGWDVANGTYKVRAEKAGCTDPNSGQTFVETSPLPVPPPVSGLVLTLSCPLETTVPMVTITAHPARGPAGGNPEDPGGAECRRHPMRSYTGLMTVSTPSSSVPQTLPGTSARLSHSPG